MAKKAPGKHERNGLSLIDIVKLFPDNEMAEQWLIGVRWTNGIVCPRCGSDNVQEHSSHPTMPHRCRGCGKFFSVRTGTVMEASNLDYQTWAIAIYLFCTSLKGIASMKIHRDLDISQKSAWHLAHRIRKAFFTNKRRLFDGPVEVDETFIGGKNKNRHASKKQKGTQGGKGKTILAGVKDRATGQVSTGVVPDRSAETMEKFIAERVSPDAIVYTDEHRSYRKIPHRHEAVNHSAGEYVRKMVHTNGIESHWSLLKRGITGTFHHLSDKHFDSYADEFDARHNFREMDTIAQMACVVRAMIGKRLKYAELVAEPA